MSGPATQRRRREAGVRGSCLMGKPLAQGVLSQGARLSRAVRKRQAIKPGQSLSGHSLPFFDICIIMMSKDETSKTVSHAGALKADSPRLFRAMSAQDLLRRRPPCSRITLIPQAASHPT